MASSRQRPFGANSFNPRLWPHRLQLGVSTTAGGTVALDGVEEADELLVPVALHAAADYGAIEHVERGEQCRGAVPLVIARHRAAASGLDGQPRLGAVERL